MERLGETLLPPQTSSNVTPSRESGAEFEEPATISSAAPVFVIRDVATEMGVGQNPRRPTKSPAPEVPSDVITNGLIGIEDASSLFALSGFSFAIMARANYA